MWRRLVAGGPRLVRQDVGATRLQAKQLGI